MRSVRAHPPLRRALAARGVDSMAVTYGAHDPQTLIQSEPTVMVTSVPEMQAWLLERV